MPRSFRFLQQLGRGAFGEVHLAEMTTDDDFVQTVAVKWLHGEYSDDSELAGRLRDEARLLGLLQHPNIVGVSGLSRIEGRLAVLMEPVAGLDLSGVTVPASAAIEVVAHVAEALDAAWETVPPGRDAPLRVVHRDIKPSNIMVTRRGRVKVMDFGVARATFEAREVQTRSQQYGTARYMAPERWLEGIAEAPSDIFSLGVTLIELVSGEPFARPRLSREGFQSDISGSLARLDGLSDIQDLCRAMLAFAPEERPTAAEVGAACAAIDIDGPLLRIWAASLEPNSGTADALTGTVVVEDTEAETFAVPATMGSLPARRAPTSTPRWPIGVAVAILLGGLAFGYSGFLERRARIATPAPVAAALPEPSPEPLPTPQPEEPTPEPEPRPEPVVVAPRPAPPPTPVPAPVEPTALPTVPLILVIDDGLTARIRGRAYGSGRRLVEATPGEVLAIQVEGTHEFSCALLISEAPETYAVRVTKECTKTG